MKCRVCGTASNTFPCPRCGFDASQDRELYPTLQNDGRQLFSVSRRHLNWAGDVPLRPHRKVLSWILPLVLGLLLGVGGTLFYFSYPQWFPDKQQDPQYGRTVDGLSWALEDGVLTISGNGVMDNYFQGQSPWYDFRSEVKTIVVEDGVTSIGFRAFSGFDRVTRVQLPDSLTEVGSYAFSGCSRLTAIVLPNGLRQLKTETFSNCSSLRTVTLPARLGVIGPRVFSSCGSLTSVHLPISLYRINYSAFQNCPILDLYYSGTEVQWYAIDISAGNESVTSATIHYSEA